MALLTTDATKNICILNPKLNPEDLKIPESVKGKANSKKKEYRLSFIYDIFRNG